MHLKYVANTFMSFTNTAVDIDGKPWMTSRDGQLQTRIRPDTDIGAR